MNMIQARKAAKLTQAEVADKLNIARTTLVAIESGQRRIRENEAREMAALYGVTVDYLLSDIAETQEAYCQTVTDVTVGLVESIRAISRVLATRDLNPPDVQAALKDLGNAEDFQTIRYQAFKARRRGR